MRDEKLLSAHSEYMRELEERFGPRDQSYEFVGIQAVGKVPHIYFPKGRKIKKVEIRLADAARRSFELAKWQLAHECVHLLDPGARPTVVLEEGLAVWFQECKVHGQGLGLHDTMYACAKALVMEHLEELLDGVKSIRRHGHRLSDVSYEILEQHVPGLSPHMIEALSRRADWSE